MKDPRGPLKTELWQSLFVQNSKLCRPTFYSFIYLFHKTT